MDGIKYTKVFCYWEKINILLMSNQDQLGQKIKHLVNLFFDVKLIAMNSHQLPKKSRRMRLIMRHTMHYKRMIITFHLGYSIPALEKKRREINLFNIMSIHLYKTSTMSTRNGAVDIQVKSNPQNNLIYGHNHCGKGHARGIITTRHIWVGHKHLYRKIDF